MRQLHKTTLLFFVLHFSSAFEITENYPRSLQLKENGEYMIYWKVTGLTQNDQITIEIHAKTLGWIGIGLSPNGGMPGSDIVIGGWNDKTAKPYLYVRDRNSAQRVASKSLNITE